MGKKSSKARRRRSSRDHMGDAASDDDDVARQAEERRSLSVTVAWTLSGLATCVAIAASLATRVLLRGDQPMPWAALPNFLLLVAALTGLASLSLTPFVYRFRETPPPLVVTWVIVCASLLPWITLLVLNR